MADLIELRGLRVTATVGVLPEEKERAQPFEIDLDIEADLRDAGQSDDLGDTINYGAVSEAVAAQVQNEHHELLERVAQRIADTVLGFDRAEAVTVVIRKLRPPVPVDLDTTGVRIRRVRG